MCIVGCLRIKEDDVPDVKQKANRSTTICVDTIGEQTELIVLQVKRYYRLFSMFGCKLR